MPSCVHRDQKYYWLESGYVHWSTIYIDYSNISLRKPKDFFIVALDLYVSVYSDPDDA